MEHTQNYPDYVFRPKRNLRKTRTRTTLEALDATPEERNSDTGRNGAALEEYPKYGQDDSTSDVYHQRYDLHNDLDTRYLHLTLPSGFEEFEQPAAPLDGTQRSAPQPPEFTDHVQSYGYTVGAYDNGPGGSRSYQ